MVFAHAARWGDDTVTDTTGRPLAAGTLVTVRNLDDALADIYSDADRTPAANPVTVGSAGNVGFYVDPGEYLLEANGVQVQVAVPVAADDVGAGGGAMSGAEILAALLTVDGAGSLLSADLLDGLSSGAFEVAGAAATVNTALGNHLTDTVDAHDDTAVSVNPSGLVVIQGADTDVHAALARLDGAFAGKVDKSLFDANTILIATADNTPLALPVAASRFLGRKATGDIDDMTPTEALAELNAVEHVAPDFKATGKTGATANPVIIAGGTAGGAPASGAHVAGEYIVDALGFGWYCTADGTPGTWVCTSSGREIFSVPVTVGTNTTTSTTLVDLTAAPMSGAVPVLPVPCLLHFHAGSGGAGGSATPANSLSGDGISVVITESTGATFYDAYTWIATANNSIGPPCELWYRIPANTAAATYKIQFAAVTAGTARLRAETYRPLLFECRTC